MTGKVQFSRFLSTAGSPLSSFDLRRLPSALLMFALSILPWDSPGVSGPSLSSEKDPGAVLRLIHGEVSALGKNQEDEILIWDFHIGPADDDTNQEEHVVVIVQELEAGVRMTIQVTELEPSPRNPNIRYGRSSRTIACLFRREGVEISRNDFPDAEIGEKLAGILEAARDKRKLLEINRFPGLKPEVFPGLILSGAF